MSHSHNHDHNHEHLATSGKNLFITLILNLGITVVELIGGIISGSLALMSDALHNFSDAFAIIITYVALKLSNVPKSEPFTFGLKRGEIIAAIINTAVLIVISFFLFIEAISRLFSPEQHISAPVMIIVASFGLAANIIGTILLSKGSKESMNIKSTYLHLFSDAVTSVGVIIGGICIWTFNIYWIDPILTIIIAAYIVKESIGIIKDAFNIVMMGKPEGISIPEIKEKLELFSEIKNVHHIHLWMLSDKLIHFEAHVDVKKKTTVQETQPITERIEKLLKAKYSITHVTLQYEVNRCNNKKAV